jgi:hypothetical protein
VIHGGFERSLHGKRALSGPEIVELETYDWSSQRASSTIQQAVDAALRVMAEYEANHFATEIRVDPGHVIGRDDLWGTADVIAVSESTKTLVVADLKTGRGPVYPRGNLQLLIYALGARQLITFEPERVVLAILQPPLHGDRPQVWETDLATLRDFEAFITQRAAATDDPNAAPNPSPQACQWCPARVVCPAHLSEGGAR